MNLSLSILTSAVLALSGISGAVQAQSVNRPNVVLILADDLGYTDISPFGGEINTPNIAQLASQGLSFTNYHTAANCAPARAMLLTGVDSHRNGRGGKKRVFLSQYFLSPYCLRAEEEPFSAPPQQQLLH